MQLPMKNYRDSMDDFKAKVKGADFLSFNQSGHIDRNTILFNSVEYKKYFKIIYCFNVMGYNMDFNRWVSQPGGIKGGLNIMATVNKTELADNSYGTKDKLMLFFIFTFKTPCGPIFMKKGLNQQMVKMFTYQLEITVN